MVAGAEPMLNILMISPWLPWPPFDGARIRILETLKFLTARHRVTLLAHVSSAAQAEHLGNIKDLGVNAEVALLAPGTVARAGRMARGLLAGSPFIQSIHHSAALARKVRQLTAQSEFDIVHIELSLAARYARAVSPGSRARKILSTHNIESERFRRELKITPWGARRLVLLADAVVFPAWEQRSLRWFDGAIAVSESDAAWISRERPSGCVCLAPNGVDTAYFRPGQHDLEAEQTLVFTGVMDYPPNIDAVVWFAKDIWPALRQRYPELIFDIVGAKPTPVVRALGNIPGVRVVGEVPDIRPYVQRARAFVVPLRSGGGTRLKILQAMALGCPVISTALGAEGLDVADGESILFAQNTDEFLAQVAQLTERADLRKGLFEQGRALVVEKYDWQRCLAGLEDLYRRVLEREGS